jgi:hypothetical protein
VPIHIPAITRRQMLKHSAAWGAAMLTSAWLLRRAWTMPPDARPHPEHWAILSDTHVAENLREVNTGVTMADNARQAAEQIATCGDRLAGVSAPGPVIVMAHHPIERVPLPKLNGLADSRELWKILTSHRQVKAYVFGHSHRWLIEQAEGIHLINVPTTAYLFRKGEPRAWTQFALSETGLHITLHKVGDGEDLPAEKMVADLSWDASSSIIPPKRPVAEHGGG